jgi:hypothetical protein
MILQVVTSPSMADVMSKVKPPQYARMTRKRALSVIETFRKCKGTAGRRKMLPAAQLNPYLLWEASVRMTGMFKNTDTPCRFVVTNTPREAPKSADYFYEVTETQVRVDLNTIPAFLLSPEMSRFLPAAFLIFVIELYISSEQEAGVDFDCRDPVAECFLYVVSAPKRENYAAAPVIGN